MGIIDYETAKKTVEGEFSFPYSGTQVSITFNAWTVNKLCEINICPLNNINGKFNCRIIELLDIGEKVTSDLDFSLSCETTLRADLVANKTYVAVLTCTSAGSINTPVDVSLQAYAQETLIKFEDQKTKINYKLNNCTSKMNFISKQ